MAQQNRSTFFVAVGAAADTAAVVVVVDVSLYNLTVAIQNYKSLALYPQNF